MSALLDTNQLRLALEPALRTANRCYLYSAFLTELAADWLISTRQFDGKERLLIRGLPFDFVSGASSFQALRKLLHRGAQIRFSTALHAKIFIVDEAIFVGSANLTGNGLALVDDPNDELTIVSNLEAGHLQQISHLWREGYFVDSDLLNRLETYLGGSELEGPDPSGVPNVWPDDLIEEKRVLYCSDFPQSSPESGVWVYSSSLQSSKAYDWLYSVVSEHGHCSFGFLSSALHSALHDDPAPYRRNVKELLANLLSYITTTPGLPLEVIRPNHSQVVQLRSLRTI